MNGDDGDFLILLDGSINHAARKGGVLDNALQRIIGRLGGIFVNVSDVSKHVAKIFKTAAIPTLLVVGDNTAFHHDFAGQFKGAQFMGGFDKFPELGAETGELIKMLADIRLPVLRCGDDVFLDSKHKDFSCGANVIEGIMGGFVTDMTVFA